jgi:hypothetical protein
MGARPFPMKDVLKLATTIGVVMLAGLTSSQPASAAELYTLRDEDGLGQLVAWLSVLASLDKETGSRSTESTAANRSALAPSSCIGPRPCQLHQSVIDRIASPTTGPGWW